MSEFRQDRTTGQWALIAPERGERPKERDAASERPPPKSYDPDCPFCPGNEARLPGVIAEVAADRAPGWRIRVVPNKHPAVSADPPPPLAAGGPVREGRGVHEVVIESPRHDADLARMPENEVAALLTTLRSRYAALLARPGVETVILFRNHGTASGASLRHPHSQLIAFGFAPPSLAARAQLARQHYLEHGSCLLCDEIALEQRQGTRIVSETPHLVAMTPYAATVPFETWIVPKRHHASFAEIADVELADLARLLSLVLQGVNRLGGDPPYNFVVDSAAKSDIGQPFSHWRLRIAPDTTTWGGFELGAGVAINPASPERDAGLLREAVRNPVD